MVLELFFDLQQVGSVNERELAVFDLLFFVECGFVCKRQRLLLELDHVGLEAVVLLCGVGGNLSGLFDLCDNSQLVAQALGRCVYELQFFCVLFDHDGVVDDGRVVGANDGVSLALSLSCFALTLRVLRRLVPLPLLRDVCL